MTWQDCVVLASPWVVGFAFVVGYGRGWRACSKFWREAMRKS